MLLPLPSVHYPCHMASRGLLLSQLERASGCMATSLSAEARGSLPCHHCLCTRRVRCLGRSTEGMWYKTCWRQWKGSAFDARLRHVSIASRLVSLAGLRFHAEGLLRVLLRAGQQPQQGGRRASCARTSALSCREGRKISVSPRVVDGEEGDEPCNCERS
jgi:hypothetical protein